MKRAMVVLVGAVVGAAGCTEDEAVGTTTVSGQGGSQGAGAQTGAGGCDDCPEECVCEASCIDGAVTLSDGCGEPQIYRCAGACADPSPSAADLCDGATEDELGSFCAPLPCPGPFDGGPILTDVAYGAEPRQLVDIYMPDVPGPGALPVFAWIHGGGWQNGSKDTVPNQVLALRERGIVVVSVEYRLSDTPFPTTISDVRAAVRWMRQEGGAHRMDPERIAAGGTSAGGHLAAMLGVASEIEALDLDASLPPPVVKLVIDFFGPSDLGAMDTDAATNGCPPGSLCHDCPGSPEVKLVDCPGNLSTCAAAADAASPVSYASSDDPPFVILHGTSDCTVPFPQGERMHQALIDAGAVSSFVETPGAGHSLAQVATPQAWQTVYDAVDEHLIGCAAR